MNHTRQLKPILAACSAAFLLGASGPAAAQDRQPAASAQAMPGQAMKPGMQDMQHKNMPMTGDADHDFATMMKSHHQAGIDMAEQELKNGKDKEMKAMAKKIIADQKKEIAKLDKWMAKHKPAAD